MNTISPKKLQGSKWTAKDPINKEKHFIVSKVTFDENNNVVLCYIEAVMTKRTLDINWMDLKDDSIWIQGWK